MSTLPPASRLDLVAENAELRTKLAEAEDMLRAIRRGEIDALVMQSDTGPRVFTLQGVDSTSNRARGEMLEIISDAVIAVDGERRVTYVNPAARQLFSLDPSAALGKPASEIPELRFLNGLITDNSTPNDQWHGEVVVRGRDSQRRHLEVTLMSRLKDCDGSARTTSILATFRDITDRKRAEGVLRENEEFNRSLMEGSADCVKVLDVDGRLLQMNGPGLCLMEIDDVGPMCGQAWSVLWPPAAGQDIERAVTAARGGDTYSFQAFCPTAKGKPRWWDVIVSPVRNGADGSVVRLLSVSRDISDRKRTEAKLRTSETRYRRLFEAAHDGVLILDPDTRKIIAANPFMTALLGYAPNQLTGMELHQLGFSADAPASRAMFETLKATRQVRYENLPLQTRQGGLREVEVVANLYDEDGRSVVQCNVRDITERRRVETESRERQHFLTRIFEVLPGVLYVFDLEENRIVFVNNATSGLVYSSEEIAGLGTGVVQTLIHPDDQQRFRIHIAHIRTLDPGATASVEYRMMDKAGAWRWYMSTDTVFLRDDSGVARQFIGVASEITDRKLAELALRESEARLRGILRQSPAGIVQTDAGGHMVLVNERWLKMLGYSESELLGKSVLDVTHSRSIAATKEAVGRLVAGGPDFQIEKTYLRKDGSEFSAHSNVSALRSSNGDFLGLIAVVLDITERLRTERALRESEARQLLVLKASQMGTFEVDLESGEAFWNPTEFELLGLRPGEALPGPATFFRHVHPEDLEALQANWAAAIQSGTLNTEFRIIRKDGATRWLAARGDISHDQTADNPGWGQRYRGVNFDITERKEQEEHVRFLMKEVNHRSKNMLALVQAVARQTATKSPLDFVTRFGERIQALAAAQDLLVKSEWKAVALSELIGSQLAHFRDLIGDRIQLHGPGIMVLPAAAQAIGMALHEMATNAGKYGALSNEIGRVEVTWNAFARQDGGPQFAMSWTESGGPAVTKPTSRGFGSTVIGAMVNMSLDCAAEVDYAPAGFRWRIACSAERLVDNAQVALLQRSVTTAAAGSKRVLVVEDEALIAMEIAAILSDAGFTVIGPVGSVAHALALIERSGCEVAVLDINLGNDTAEPIARVLSARATPFVTISGYAREQQPAAFRNAPLVSKPVRPERLVAEVRKCLGKAH